MKLDENMIKEKMKQKYPADERTAQINEKGLAACGAAALFYVVGRLIWCGFRGELAVPELVLLFVMLIFMSAIKRKNGLCDLPSVMGKRLDPAVFSKPKRIGLYALSAFLYASSWAFADCVFKVTSWEPLPLRILMDLFLSTLAFFLIDYVINEHQIRRYCKAIEQLDEEENKLY